MSKNRESRISDDVRRPPRTARDSSRGDQGQRWLVERTHRAAEERVREAEQKFRTIFDNTSDGIFLHDLETRKLTMCNRSCLQMLGYTREEFLNLSVSDLHPPADLPFIYTQIEEFLKGGKPIRHDIRFQRKDGGIFFVDLNPDLVVLDGKRYVLVAMQDITERKCMEEELRQHAERLEELVAARTDELQKSEQRYRSLAENDPDIIQRFDRELRRLYVNPAFEPATGVSPQAAVGKTDRELGLPEDLIPFWEEAMQTVFRTGQSRIIRFATPTPKERRHYEAHLVPEFAPDGATEHVLAITRDITNRVRTEEALRESEERYRCLYHTIADGVFVIGAEGRIDEVNDSACLQLGYTRGELLGMPVSAISARSDFDLGEIFAQLRTAGSLSYETTHRRKDGTIVPVELSVTLLEHRGQPAVLGVVRDITERKRAEEALRQLSRKNEEALRVARMGHWEFDFTTRMFTFNDQYYTLHGTTAREAGGYQMSAEEFARKYVHPDDAHLVQESIQQATAIEDPDFQLQTEARIRRTDGEARWVIVWFRVEKDAQGKTSKLYGVNQDITDRRCAEQALRESEERFRTAFEEGAVGMALTAMDSTLLKVNSAFCRMLGFNESELVGRSFTEITHPDDIAANLVGTRRLAAGEISSFRMEKRYLRKDGVVVWADMNTASVRDTEGRPLYCVTHIQDITDRKQAQEAMRRLNEQLELQVAQRTEDLCHTVNRLRQLTLELSQAEDRERERIADILHEDVQQILAAARFHLNLLGSGICSGAESGRIVEQVRQMLKDAIEKSRDLSHELSPALYQVELTAILEWLARHMEQRYGLTVRVEAHGPVDSSSEPLKAFLYRVAQELLFNVVKHAGVKEARIRVRRRGRCIYLSAVDQGRGFDPQKLEATTGFGLLGIQERVQLLGGRMKIRSVPGRGSRFLIEVPDQQVSQAPLP